MISALQRMAFGAPPTVVNTYRRALFAARFMKPPSQYKRQLLREKPRNQTAPFENPVRRYVRLKEKEREFNLIPPKRLVPVPKIHKPKVLQSIEGVPTISESALLERLKMLLSDQAVSQQLAEPIFPFESSGHPELRMWKRQVREIRKIYRAQYLQKLAEVTEFERTRQLEQMANESKVKADRWKEKTEKFAEWQKRRAIIKDRRRLDTQIKLATNLQESTTKKAQRIYFQAQLEARAVNWSEQGAAAALGEGSVSREQAGLQARLFDRNTSVPHLAEHLGLGRYGEKSPKKRLAPHYDFFRKVTDESFKLLPEDAEPIIDARDRRSSDVTQTSSQRAKARYAGFDEDTKLKLLDEKIAMIEAKLDKEAVVLGAHGSNANWSLLLEQLQAAKAAYLEKKLQAEGKQRLQQED